MGALDNKVALVTGGSRGIGAAIARGLSREGAAVSITYVTSREPAEALARSIEKEGGRALAIQADGAEVSDVKAAMSQTVNAFGALDILVNNAGIERPGTIENYSLQAFDEMVAVNIKAVFVAIQEAIRYMREGGRIINIGSISSDYMPVPGHAVYAMTKGAIASLTRGLARDLGPRGITVNNVQPGRIDTDLLRSAVGSMADQARQTIALRRFGDSDEVAGLVAYLAGPDAAFVTGANLKIDGGASL
jgi:3-oxoacyl-[acyl-carrier protein] reductase